MANSEKDKSISKMNTQRDPLVAICIPAYEKPEEMKRLLDSIILQSYKNYKVVITDNSRTNAVECQVKNYNNSKIIYHKNEKQIGPAGNSSYAIKCGLAEGADLIKIMYSDDFFSAPNSLEKMVNVQVSTEAFAVFAADFEVTGERTIPRVPAEIDIGKVQKDHSVLFLANYLGAPSTILFRADPTEFDKNVTMLMDVDFYYRLLRGRNFVYIFEPLISIGHDGDQLSDFYNAHRDLVAKEFRYVMNKYPELRTFPNYLYLLKYRTIDSLKVFVKSKLEKRQETK